MYVQVKDMYICIKKGKSTRFLALKIWALAVLKFFDVVLKFEVPNARVLNFSKNSALSLIGPVLIIGDCVYLLQYILDRSFAQILFEFCFLNRSTEAVMLTSVDILGGQSSLKTQNS